MFLEGSAGTSARGYCTLPFLQTSYPYRCRSKRQRSRIGMRFPSSATPKPPFRPTRSRTLLFLQTLIAAAQTNHRPSHDMRFPSSATVHKARRRTLPFQTSYLYRCRSMSNNVIA